METTNNRHKTTRKINEHGETVHTYRGFDIELSTSTPAGYWGRYSFYFKTRQRFCKLQQAKAAIDSMLSN